jgi:hypothetical protein
MKITNEMLEAAMKKAVEAGLLPRHSRREDISINQELIRIVLQAALDASAAPATAPVRQLQVVRQEPASLPASRRFALVPRTQGSGSYAR